MTGQEHQFSISVPNDLPPHVSTGNPVYEIVLLENFWTGGGDCPPLRFVARATSVVTDVYLNINIDLPEFIGINPDDPQIMYITLMQYQQDVTNVIRDASIRYILFIGQSDTSAIRIHQATYYENFQVGFLLEFQNIFIILIQQIQIRQYLFK